MNFALVAVFENRGVSLMVGSIVELTNLAFIFDLLFYFLLQFVTKILKTVTYTWFIAQKNSIYCL